MRAVALVSLALGCTSAAPAQPPQGAASGVAPAAQTAPPPVRVGDAPEHAYTAEFFPGTRYDASIEFPDAWLAAPLGSRPATHAEVIALWRAWAARSPRVKLESYGRTHEGRELVYGVVSSPDNVRNLDAILARIAQLADPRELAPGEEVEIAARTPAVAWLAYSIHGDEMSGVDGGLALAYHLIAGQGGEVETLLRDLVVVFDPVQNPDGRERFLAMLQSTAGAVPNLDADSLHRGRWPYGRGNHYQFDMNRDWMAGVAPETRGRWRALQRFHPQLFVDAHEMSGYDSYLFYPQARPHNPELPPRLDAWHQVFAADQSAAFDAHGWAYYTREWADAWGPYYSDAWGSLQGAIGILYEQARYEGQSLRVPSGDVVTYREAAHHQAVSSLANLRTLAAHRAAILADFVAAKRRYLDAESARRFFVLPPGRHAERESWLASTLAEQGVEVHWTSAATRWASARSSLGASLTDFETPAGTLVVPLAQPLGNVVRAYLEFDVRYSSEDLLEERKSLETKGESKAYDATAWDLAHALGLEAYWCEAASAPELGGPVVPGAAAGGVADLADAAQRPIGWVVDGDSDASVAFAARAMEHGLVARLADEAFAVGGVAFARGSVLVRAHENGENARELVERAAKEARVVARAIATGRSSNAGADLGGRHFRLLARPRVALLSNAPVSVDGFGHVWHHVDRNLGLPATLVDAQQLSSYDLRRYNVLVVPPTWGLRRVVEPVKDDLEAWVRSGGTLIAIGASAEALADASLGLSSVRNREDVLGEVESYRAAAERERAARNVQIDERLVWDGVPSAAPTGAQTPSEGPAKSKDAPDDDDAKRDERWKQRFSPAGVFLAADVDEVAWITAGCPPRMPVYFEGSTALFARGLGVTPVRLATSAEVRIAGLLWPEARERLADTAYLTVERLGHGQVILFASAPGFRGFHAATARLLSNAIVCGPGIGASQPVGW